MYLTIQLVDNPATVIAQLVVGVALLRYFFEVRHEGWPMAQLTLALSISVFCGLTARVVDADWFYVPDMVQYATWAGVIIVATGIKIKQRKQEAARPGATVMIPDAIDRRKTQIIWGAVVLAVGLLIVAYVKAYNDKRDAIADKDRIALQENTRVRNEQKEQAAIADARDEAKQDSLLRTLDVLAKNDTTLLNNQHGIMGQNATLSAKVDHKSALTRKTIRDAVGKLPVQTIAPKEPQPEDKPKNLYEKLKNLFRHKDHGRASVDSLGHAYFRPDYSAPGDTARLPE